MRKLISIFLLIILLKPVSACDQCGCSMAGSFNTVTSYANNNFLILRSSLGSYYNYALLPEKINAEYLTFDLVAGYNITKNLHITGYVPYKVNKYSGSDINYNAQGIGDAGLIANYIVMTNRDSLMKKYFYSMSVKGGVELPTGKFNTSFRTNNLPAAVSIGSGSIDLMTGARFVYKKKNMTLLADYTYKYNFANSMEYQFGDQHLLTMLATRKCLLSKSVITPFAGISGEATAFDQYHGYNEHGTKGNNVFLDLGCEYGFNKIILGATVDLPAYSDFSGEAAANPKYGLRVAYLFD